MDTTLQRQAKPAVLSYEKLLQVTSKLPGDEQQFVLSFLLNNDRKLRLRIQEMDRERREYEAAIRHVNEYRQRKNREDELLVAVAQANAKVKDLQKRIEGKNKLAKKRFDAIVSLSVLIRRLLGEGVIPLGANAIESLGRLTDGLNVLLAADEHDDVG
jgi:hypothetical protein